MILDQVVQLLKDYWSRTPCGKQKGSMMIVILAFCAIIVTLAVTGVIGTNNPVEEIADEVIKVETGVDLEKAEKEIINKNEQ